MPTLLRPKRDRCGLVIAGLLTLGGQILPPLSAERPAQTSTNTSSLNDQAKPRQGGEPDFQGRRAQLFEQRKATLRAEAEYHNARFARALAEIALAEYEQVTFQQDLATAEGEVQSAESELHRALEHATRAREMFEKGLSDRSVSAELELKKARFRLQQAQSKRTILVRDTKTTKIKALRREVERAYSNDLAKKAAWDREKTRLAELERDLDLKESRLRTSAARERKPCQQIPVR